MPMKSQAWKHRVLDLYDENYGFLFRYCCSGHRNYGIQWIFWMSAELEEFLGIFVWLLLLLRFVCCFADIATVAFDCYCCWCSCGSFCCCCLLFLFSLLL